MSNEWDDGAEEFPAEQANESEGMKNLRAALARQKKQIEEQKATNAKLLSRDRERTLNDVLRSKGLNTKLANFYPEREEATEEKVLAWLTDNADVFGHPSTPPQTPGIDQVPPELQEAFKQFQQPLGADAQEDMISKINNFEIKDDADMQKFIAFMRQNPQGMQNRG
jgi:hypothetical protein